jgi:hypothetical protein
MNALILSNARDTNGQNARYVEAAKRWGDDPSVVKALAIGRTDPAGVVGRFSVAAEKIGGLVIRSASKAKYEYLQFPMDIYWDRQSERLIAELANEADVIHLNNSDIAYRRFRLRKPALLHHHGSLFRSNPKHWLDVARHFRMIHAVSTIDLQRPAPDILNWLPSAYNVDELAAYAEAHKRAEDGRIRIVQCPTDRDAKHTGLLIEAVRQLQAEKLPIDLVIVGPDKEARTSGVTWAESLEAKAGADIIFDQLTWGYGCNSIEAWGMGKPVISGADEWTLARMANEFPAVPFEEATEQTLKAVIRSMVKSVDLREDAAQRGLAHVRKYHDELPALTRLAELYGKAIKHHTRVRIPGKAESVTFRNSKGKLVYDDEGNRIVFHDGLVKVSDPFVIERLRGLSKGRPSYGIEEVA